MACLKKYVIANYYADDTCMFYSNKDPKMIYEKINYDLKIMSKWLNANKLVINANKCESMIIGTKQRLKKWNNLIDGNYFLVLKTEGEIKEIREFKVENMVLLALNNIENK